MTDFSTLLQQGNAWLFVPSAILLGALHGLEPGHSKTMMAAFIVAVRGTLAQAVLLGLAATVSHTAVVWAIAMAGLYFGQGWDAETSEPYFQIASGVLILGVAAWMLWRTRREQQHARDHHHGHGEAASKCIYTEHGTVELEIFEDGVPPRFRLRRDGRRELQWKADDVTLETQRPDGASQVFRFVQKDGYLESLEEIPEPHAFVARVKLGHDDHNHLHYVAFAEHDHAHADPFGGSSDSGEHQDAHERAHADDIRRRFANRQVTTGQIIVFGLTGGLIPCPASITVLLLCLHLKEITLGATLVLCFSVGLALTLVVSGALAALSVRHVSKRWSGFGTFARRAPYFSGALIAVVGVYVAYSGFAHLQW